MYESTVRDIDALATPHFETLNQAVEAAYPRTSDAAFAAAMGLGVSMVLRSLSNPAKRADAVGAFNQLTRLIGYRLVPVA